MRGRRLAVALAVGAGALGLAGAATAAPGDLDPSFSGDGKLVQDVTGGRGSGVAVDSQGRIVVAGKIDPAGADATSTLVARFLPDGSLDPSFSGDGLLEFDGSGLNQTDEANDVAVDSQDRPVLVGYASNGVDLDSMAARITTAGALDPSYGGGDGIFKQNMNPGNFDRLDDLTLDASGRVVATGAAGGANENVIVARLSTSGALDSSFNGGTGFTLMNVNSVTSQDWGKGVGVDPQGRILVAGSTSIAAGQTNFFTARLTSAGALDTSFSNDLPTPGREITFMSSEAGSDMDDFATDLAVLPDGKVLVTGLAEITGHLDDFALLRLTAAGAVDASFNGDGKAYADFGGDDSPSSMFVDSAGRPVLAGTSDSATDAFAVARLTPGGALDPAFSGDGVTVTDVGPGADFAESVDRDPVSGRIVVVGYEGPFLTADLALARYEGADRCGGKVPTIVGTAGADKLKGTSGADVIAGGDGKDTISGLAGKDTLCGEAGKDTLKGGTGNDKLLGGAGNDKLLGGAGKDRLKGGAGRDLQRQ